MEIQGKKVLKAWESFNGWKWFGIEKVDDHIWFGLVVGFETEWGYFDERELEALKPWVWEIRKQDLDFVEVEV